METIAVDSKYYLHDLDKAALKALRAVPGFHQLARAFMKLWHERQSRIENMSSRVRINEHQLSEYYDMLPPICDRLGIELPELYLELDVNPNSYTYGDTNPYVVITSGLLETIPKDLVPTVLAHECGHIACHHTLCTTMGNIVFGATAQVITNAINLPLAGLVSVPLEVAFAYWMRCSEYSADRAAVICDGGAEKMSDVCMRFAGFDKDIDAVAKKQEFMAQAAEYREMTKDSKWDKALEFLLLSTASHPLTAVRALECEEWEQSDRFQSILDGSFLNEDVEDDSADDESVDERDADGEGQVDEESKKARFAIRKGPKLPFGPWGQKDDAQAAEQESSHMSEAEQIREFKGLLDDGIITEEEFETKKRQLLGI